jgi:DNA replication and repair protein RecF
MEIELSERPAKDIVSRGQQKLLAAGLVLGQLEFLNTARGLRSTLLLDDPAAELDTTAIDRFMTRVFALGAQLLLTSLPMQLSGLSQRSRVFHVEQGRIERVL